MQYHLQKANATIEGSIALESSKSISNRALIIQSLCAESFEIEQLSEAKDTTILGDLLAQKEQTIYDAKDAGTAFRFLTAVLAFKEGTQILTGSARMQQRPIGDLVAALNAIGANITYMGAFGYPPLQIEAPHTEQLSEEITISANISSQFISALLMIAPTLPKGLTLNLEGDIVSRSYIEMTLAMMSFFGIHFSWEGNTITITPQSYLPRTFRVEADWSAASYYYAIAIFADKASIHLKGLHLDSLQGDSIMAHIGTEFGIKTTATDEGILLEKSTAQATAFFEKNFSSCPDIAQTLAVICGGNGTLGLFSGIDTLKIKETDRIAALQNELAKIQVWMVALPTKFSKKQAANFYQVEGKATWDSPPTFDTYNDHRMAMAFAALVMLGDVIIDNPTVVEKSYPNFWNDLQTLGIHINKLT